MLKAGSLQRLHREAEAEPVFQELLAHLDQLPSDAMRHDVLLAAAQCGATRGYSAIGRPFREAAKARTDGIRGAIEFAGVLYRDDRLAEAIATLRVGEQTTKELLFLASLYSSEKEFATAAEVCREALVAAPYDLPALAGWPTILIGGTTGRRPPRRIAACSSVPRKTRR